jgi:hypothetical protein
MVHDITFGVLRLLSIGHLLLPRHNPDLSSIVNITMSTEANPTQTTTNESSPSSIAPSTKAGLEKALSQRPDREELVNKNILPGEC